MEKSVFITFYGVKELMEKGEGKLKITCLKEPKTIPNGVEGHWTLHYVPNNEDKELPLVTTGRDAKIREPKRLHGLFTLLMQLNVSPITIPVIPNTVCFVETNAGKN